MEKEQHSKDLISEKDQSRESYYKFSFEKLNAWKEARILSMLIYSYTSSFPKSELFGLVDQARRAVVSVASNLSEGSYRTSKKDRYHFYQISYGNLMEVMNLILLAKDFAYVNEKEVTEVRKQVEVVSALITGLSKSIKLK